MELVGFSRFSSALSYVLFHNYFCTAPAAALIIPRSCLKLAAVAERTVRSRRPSLKGRLEPTVAPTNEKDIKMTLKNLRLSQTSPQLYPQEQTPFTIFLSTASSFAGISRGVVISPSRLDGTSQLVLQACDLDRDAHRPDPCSSGYKKRRRLITSTCAAVTPGFGELAGERAGPSFSSDPPSRRHRQPARPKMLLKRPWAHRAILL